MDFIPIEPSDDLNEMMDSLMQFPFSFVLVNNPGDYENENIVLVANEDIESLYDFIFTYQVEDTETGLPDYSKCRLLTFDDLELEKGSYLQIFTRKGHDTKAIEFETSALHEVVYWGLPEPIWHVPHSYFEMLRRGESYSAGPNWT